MPYWHICIRRIPIHVSVSVLRRIKLLQPARVEPIELHGQQPRQVGGIPVSDILGWLSPSDVASSSSKTAPPAIPASLLPVTSKTAIWQAAAPGEQWPREQIQADPVGEIGSEEPAQCCIASSRQLTFALSHRLQKALPGCLACWRTNQQCTELCGSYFCFCLFLLELILHMYNFLNSYVMFVPFLCSTITFYCLWNIILCYVIRSLKWTSQLHLIHLRVNSVYRIYQLLTYFLSLHWYSTTMTFAIKDHLANSTGTKVSG
jgi:hypothetical protein